MNEEERWRFDLQGYLVIENALDAETVARMNAWIDAQAEADPKWQGQTGNVQIPDIVAWHPMFRALIDHPRALPILKELMGSTLRLDHDYAIFLQPGHGGLVLHGPNGDPFDPCHYYHFAQGRMYCGLTVATFALTDVPPGSGGLAVISGSHKSHFPVPNDIRKFERDSPVVQQVPTRAGDCVIFTEALIHGTLPWKGPGVRRTLFFKYAPGSLSWSNRRYFPAPGNPRVPEMEAELTEAQRALLQPPSANDFRRRP